MINYKCMKKSYHAGNRSQFKEVVKVSMMLSNGRSTNFLSAGMVHSSFSSRVFENCHLQVVPDPNFQPKLLFVARDAQRVFEHVKPVKNQRSIFGDTFSIMGRVMSRTPEKAFSGVQGSLAGVHLARGSPTAGHHW